MIARTTFHDCRRHGMTLVELLLVIAIIGILIGILVPAVQYARESARLAQCTNNLKQIGLGFHGHYNQLGYFPTGGWGWWEPPTYVDGVPAVGRQQGASWAFQILPYLEEQSVWSGGAGVTDTDRILTAVGTPIPLYFCPSRGSRTVTYSDPGYLGGMMVSHALCDYAGSNMEETGVIQRYEPSRLEEITDGASMTLLVAEKRLNRGHIGQWQEDDNEGYTAGWDEDTMRVTDQPPLPDHRSGGSGGLIFGASHTRVFNAVFADGSVHTLSYLIDSKVFENLGNKADGQSVNQF